MTMGDLSSGALRDIMVNERLSANPVIQLIQLKEINSKGAGRRFKVAVSDGVTWTSGMCNTRMSQDIVDDKVSLYNIVKVTQYSVNAPSGRKLMVLLDYEVVSREPTAIIGQPAKMDETEEPAAPAPVTSVPAPAATIAAPVPARPPPQRMTAAPTHATDESLFIPISSVNTYMNNWTIKAKVIQKAPMKTWNNARGSGKLFSLTLKDAEGDEIRGTFFNQAADEWFGRLEIDHVYSVKGGRVKVADRKFNKGPCEYEISFDSSTVFSEIQDSGDIGGMSYRFIKLSELENAKDKTSVDILAVVKTVEAPAEISTRKGMMTKRMVSLVDASEKTVDLTIWGEEANNFPEAAVDRVIMIKDAWVSEFRGKQLSLSGNSCMKIAPLDPEAVALQQWYDGEGKHVQFSAVAGGGDYATRVLYLNSVNEQGLGQRTDASDWFTFYGLASSFIVERQIYYQSCPNPTCRGKKVDTTDNVHVCNVCNKQIPDPVPRFRLPLEFADFSGKARMDLLGDDDLGKALIGYTASEWAAVASNEGSDQTLVVDRLFTPFKVRCGVKTDEYNQTRRQKFSVRGATPVDFVEAANFFAAEIEKY